LAKKKKCREDKDVSNSCRKLLNKCNSRVFRATHSDCDKKPGDKEWLKKKCLTKVFRDKFQSTCEELCADKKYSTKNPKACEFVFDKNPEDVETLEDIVSKCKDVSYKMKNKEKCEVVETIDVILASGEQTDKEENEVIEDNEASQVKNEVVKSIERQTTQERNNMKKKPAKDKTKIKREKNQIKEEKKHNQKKDKKKQTQKKNKKESDKQNNKNKGDKSKNQKKKVKSDREKSKCNKPKYAAMHPEECRNLEKMEKVIKDKCRKEKYRSKHKERCDMLKNAGKKDLANNVMNQVMDVRCQKESFRSNYTELCKGSSYSDSSVKTSWLAERCKHDKFAQRNTDLCASINNVQTDQEHIEAFSDVVDDIKDIVTNENKVEQDTDSKIGMTPPSTTSTEDFEENEIVSDQETESAEETTVRS